MKKKIKNLSNNKKLKKFLANYNIPQAYFSKSRDMASRGVLIGVFVAFIPIPMQMLVVLLSMKLFKFNVPVALILCWITNPFTMPFIYYIEYIVGSFLLNTEIQTMHMSIEWFNNNFTDIFIPLYFGAFILASVISVSSYYLLNLLWIYFVNKNKKIHYKKR